MPSQPIYWTKMAAGDNPNTTYKPPGAKQGLVGAATAFDSGQYNTSGMVYPDDLMSQTNNQYGNNYVIFYINVHEDSFLRKDAGGKISMAPPKNSISKQVSENKENEMILLKERANRYTYEGKFANFNFLQKIEKKVFNKKLQLSFAEFKKLGK